MKKLVFVLAMVAAMFEGCKKDGFTEYTVTFNSNGGSYAAPQTVAKGDVITTPPAPTKDGYVFVGWFTYDSKFANAKWVIFPYTVISNVTFYAIWSVNVSFDSNGGSTIMPWTVAEGKTVFEPPVPTKIGYTFAGWFTDNGTFENKVTFPYAVTAEVTFFAKWDINIYTVSFNSNGGSTIMPQTMTHGEQVTEPVTPTRSGYVFLGWFIDTYKVNFQ